MPRDRMYRAREQTCHHSVSSHSVESILQGPINRNVAQKFVRKKNLRKPGGTWWPLASLGGATDSSLRPARALIARRTAAGEQNLETGDSR